MSAERVVYSIQHTYIIKSVSKSEKRIFTCDERIDIPMIEPSSDVKTVVYSDNFSKIIPCIELAGSFLDDFKFVFETNEGVTVLPVKLYPGVTEPLDNPYLNFRYVLVLPRNATGVKSCKLFHKATGKEVQHNLTFGIMPPPYNYDNALFGYLSYGVKKNSGRIDALETKMDRLKLKIKPIYSESIQLPKNSGKQTINIEDWELFFDTKFSYNSYSEPTIHKPRITLRGRDEAFFYTLSLNKTVNAVSIDLFTCMLTVYDTLTGEIVKQIKIGRPYGGFESISFEDFDDIKQPELSVTARGARVNV